MTTFLQQLKLLDRSGDLLQTWTGCGGGWGGCSEGVEILMTQRRRDVIASKLPFWAVFGGFRATVGVFFVRLPRNLVHT